MPAIASGKVLLTGINGFSAMWIAKGLLEAGFSVRGTVRSAAKATHPREYFKSYGVKLEVVIVEDITKTEAFDNAVKEVDAVVHTAAGFHLAADDPEEIIRPAVDGTLSLLNSVLKHGKKVKRVVQMSSVSAVHDQHSETRRVFTEEDWDDHIVEICKTKGKAASGSDKYEASKTLSERAAWEFMAQHKGAIKWDLVSINPGLILGPGIQEVDDPKKLNTSLWTFYFFVTQGMLGGDHNALATPSVNWIDIRDFVPATVATLTKEKAGGERFVLAWEQFTWQDWINVVREFDPTIPAGNPAWKRKDTKWTVSFDTSKAQQILGLTFHSWEACARSVMDYYKSKGWLGTQ